MKKRIVGFLFSTLCLSLATAPLTVLADDVADLQVPQALFAQSTSLISPDSFRLGVDDFITGSNDSSVKKVALYVNGLLVRNGSVYSDGTFEVEAGDVITSMSDKVEVAGLDRRGNELERQTVSIEKEDILLTTEEYTLFDDEIRGVAGNNMGVVSLMVNDELIRSVAVNSDNSFTIPVEDGDIIELEDHVEIVGSLFGKELGRIVVPVNAVDVAAAIDVFANGVDQAITGTVTGKGLSKAKKARLYVNRKRYSEAVINEAGQFSLGTERLSLTFKDDVKVAVLTENGDELGRYQVAIAQKISDVFPDVEFARLISYNLYKNDTSEVITQDELSGISSLSLIDKNWVQDLTGIEHMAGLTELHLMNFHGEDIGWNIDFNLLSNLTNLETVNISGSGDMKDLSWVKNLKNITRLEIYSNRNLANINDIGYLSNLEYLDLSNNNITDISPVSDLGNLRYLDVRETPITNFETLSHLTELEIRK